MAEVTWSPRALADLGGIADYHALSSKRYARVIVAKLFTSTDRLMSFPRSGRSVPEIEDEQMREIIVRNYRIVYFYDESDDAAEVLTVFHASQQSGAPPHTDR